MRRRRSIVVQQTDKLILPIVRQLKSDHPFWGYRRIWAYLTFVEKQVINKKRVYRLLRENGLLVSGKHKATFLKFWL